MKNKCKRIKSNRSKYISEKDPCFIVAEMSANHGRNLKIAKKVIREAKKAGADAIKIQTYTPEMLTIPSRNKYFQIRHAKWGGQSLFDLYKKAYMPLKWHKDLKKVADDEGIVFFSTPFGKEAVDLLEKLAIPIYKIASFELVDIPLIKYVAQTGKPIIMSTGMATQQEIGEAVKTARDNGSGQIVLLKCISSYPADPAEMNLRTIPDLRRRFKTPVGLSDHTLDIGVAIASVALGAKVIEKHFTFSRKIRNPDSFFSIEPPEMRQLVKNVREVEAALGSVHYGLSKQEEGSRMYRRSLFAVRDINKGEVFSEENVRSIRPGHGLKPKYYDKVLGKKAKKDIKAGVPLTWSVI